MYIRIIYESERRYLEDNGKLELNKEHWPFSAGEGGFLFSTDNVQDTVSKYGPVIANLRSLKQGDKLYVIKVSVNGAQVQADRSGCGWDPAFFGEIFPKTKC